MTAPLNRRTVAQAEAIVHVAAETSGWDAADLLGPSRVRALTAWRMAAVWVIRETLDPRPTWETIAYVFQRDVSTVVAAHRRVDTDADLLTAAEEIVDVLEARLDAARAEGEAADVQRETTRGHLKAVR